MRKFKCRPFYDIEVDLDDPKTYEHLPNDIGKLRNLMFEKIGYSYCYMNFWHKEIFSDKKSYASKQKKRIKKLIKNFTENARYNYNNILWYKEQVFIFEDEIENFC